MKLHESMFPIVINSVGNSWVTFTSPTEGLWESGHKVDDRHDLEYFLSKVIARPDLYIVESVGGNEFPIVLSININQNITFNSFNDGVWDDGSKTTLKISHFFNTGNVIVSDSEKSEQPTYRECAIEDMPLGAKLLGFYHDSELVEIAISPNNIEVHENSYTLLLRHGVSPSRVFAEVNLKRGEKVRYEK